MTKHILLFFAIAIYASLFAQDKIECDRPDQNETPSLVPAGYFQIENGFAYQHKDDKEQHITYPYSLLKYGLGNIAELRVEVQAETQHKHQEHLNEYYSGIAPITVGFKLKICEEKGARPKTSIILSSGIPILASKGLRDKYPSPEIRVTMQHTLSKKVTLGYNVGGYCDGEDFNPEALYTVTSDYALTDNLHAYIEFYGFFPYHKRQEHHFDGGFTFTPVKNIMLDINAGVDVMTHPGWFAGFGCSFRLPG